MAIYVLGGERVSAYTCTNFLSFILSMIPIDIEHDVSQQNGLFTKALKQFIYWLSKEINYTSNFTFVL